MSGQRGDWRADVDAVGAALIDGFQSGFPVTERPFRAVGDALGTGETDALGRARRLCERGVFRRFGAVLNPPVLGASTLAALRVPQARFDAVAEAVNAHPQVNHNYRRDHEWNMWFVVTAGSLATRDRILAEIEDETGLAVLTLPMRTDFYIDLEFPVTTDDRFARESGVGGEETVSATRISEDAAVDLAPFERRLLLAVQDGLPLSATPYGDVAAALDAPVADVLAATERLLEAGCLKRIGLVVDHLATGFDANCMVVWDVPDDQLLARGERVGALPYVTLCYHRPRREERGWPYNLFTMVHGRERGAVDEKIDELAGDHLPHPHERLYSTETLKQTGARYEEIVGRE